MCPVLAGSLARHAPTTRTPPGYSIFTMASSGEELAALIEAKGQEIRTLKSEGLAKDALKPHIDELLLLKNKFQSTTGSAYVAPGQEKKPKKPAAGTPAAGGEPADPNKKSKKQLQREKKEAENAIKKAKNKEEREKKQAEASAKGAAEMRCVV